MKTAAISRLKAALSECIGWVKSGEEVLVTERGKPVAKIVPVEGLVVADARRLALARRGVLRLGKGSISKKFIDSMPVVRIDDSVLRKVIDQEREDRL